MIGFIVFEVLFFGALLAADLVSKHFVMPFLEANGSYTLIDKVLTLTPDFNSGAGFGILSGKTGALIAITTIGLALLLGVSVYCHIKLKLSSRRTRFLLAVLVMMLAGGVGNLVDRIAFGTVRDFIDYTVVYTLFKRNFAICNVADIWLTVGMILLLVYVIFLWKEEDVNKKTVPADSTNVNTALYLLAKREAREDNNASSVDTVADLPDAPERREEQTDAAEQAVGHSDMVEQSAVGAAAAAPMDNDETLVASSAPNGDGDDGDAQ